MNKFTIVSIILLTILFMGAVSAADEYDTAAEDMAVDTGDYKLTSPAIDEIDAGGDANSSDSSSADEISQDDNAIGTDVKSVENTKEKLGASNDNDALGVDYDYFLTPQLYIEQGFNENLMAGNYKLVGTFDGDVLGFPYIVFDSGCYIDGSEATFVNMGLVLQGDVTIDGLTVTSTRYIDDEDDYGTEGALVFITGDDNIIRNADFTYCPPAEGYDTYGVYINQAGNFQLLDSVVTFTGESLADYYEYAMKIVDCEVGLIQGNTITANLPILDVDYSKGDPGLDTDLVLNTGIKEVTNLDIINNRIL